MTANDGPARGRDGKRPAPRTPRAAPRSGGKPAVSGAPRGAGGKPPGAGAPRGGGKPPPQGNYRPRADSRPDARPGTRSERPSTPPAPRGPAIDKDVTGFELDKDVRRELTTLRAEAAEAAGMHLVMVARLLDEDPEGAYAHAEAARRHGPRVAVIREALGIAAYHAGKYAEALAELRAARRISGNQEHWPMMADCERALGHPEKALQMAAAPEVAQLTRAAKVEMRIVAAGARADLGQLDAAVVTLQSPELGDNKPSEWSARLRYAYAAALEAVGRHEEARTWFERAAAADPDGLTDAAERLAELDGVVFLPDEEFDEVADQIDAPAAVRQEPAAVVEDPAVEQRVAVGEPPVAVLKQPALAVDQAAALFREPDGEFGQTALVFDEPAEEPDSPARTDG